ncbi:Cytochrome c oxidase subunit 6B [Blattella germanica]|nr:Cytochrome c oxidase subunit 6B [Blattella germanica]
MPWETYLYLAPLDLIGRRSVQMRRTYCWQSYVDYYRCQKLKGEGYEPCEYFRKCFESLCPYAWVEKWDTQREENRFPGKI